MAVRTTETTVTFRRPFMLGIFDSPQPAGTYRLVIEEEDIPGLTFLAYRRMATMLHIPAISISDHLEQVFFVGSAELAAALEADEQA
ncbi:MAG: hypothetical protein WBP94_14880 [Rhodomicrobiaceae bacterium]